MGLVDAERCPADVLSGAIVEVIAIRPGEVVGARHARCRLRADFRPEAERVGLERQKRAMHAHDLVFVTDGLAYFRHENLPNAGIPALAHDMAAAVPGVEITN